MRREDQDRVRIDSPMRHGVVTSAGPGEGKAWWPKTGVRLAQAGIAPVSADLRRPRLDTLFPGAEQSPGLTGVIAGLSMNGKGEGTIEAHLRKAVIPGGVSNLAILPAGVRPPNPAELLNSRRMGDVLDAIIGACDVVIVATPPLLRSRAPCWPPGRRRRPGERAGRGSARRHPRSHRHRRAGARIVGGS